MRIYNFTLASEGRLLAIHRRKNYETQTMRGVRARKLERDVDMIRCKLCKTRIKVGEKVVSKPSGTSRSTHQAVLYHFPCAERVNIV